MDDVNISGPKGNANSGPHDTTIVGGAQSTRPAISPMKMNSCYSSRLPLHYLELSYRTTLAHREYGHAKAALDKKDFNGCLFKVKEVAKIAKTLPIGVDNEIYPNINERRHLLAICTAFLSPYQKAEAVLQEALEAVTGLEKQDIICNLAVLYFFTWRFEKAEEMRDRALQIHKHGPTAKGQAHCQLLALMSRIKTLKKDRYSASYYAESNT